MVGVLQGGGGEACARLFIDPRGEGIAWMGSGLGLCNHPTVSGQGQIRYHLRPDQENYAVCLQ